jgi:hypothetical protein
MLDIFFRIICTIPSLEERRSSWLQIPIANKSLHSFLLYSLCVLIRLIRMFRVYTLSSIGRFYMSKSLYDYQIFFVNLENLLLATSQITGRYGLLLERVYVLSILTLF